jgi:hypothetical protein
MKKFPYALVMLSPTGSKCRNTSDKTPYFFGVFFKESRLWEGCGSLVGENTSKGGNDEHYRRSQPEA